MSRQNFDDGQEIIYQDFNKISSLTQKLIFDKMLYELIGRNQEGFFQDSLSVSRVSNTEVSVKKGLGFQFISDNQSEPDMKPLVLDASSSVIIPVANPVNDRIDIILCKASLVDSLSENRKYKDAFDDTISTESVVVQRKWLSDISVVTGVPAPAPVAPAVPAGFVLLAEILVEAANGVTASANISDKRELLPLAGSVGLTGSREFDAITGDTTKVGFSHETLKAALDDNSIGAGSKILVTRSEDIDDIPSVDKNDIEIVFKSGVTFSKGTAAKGIILNANGTKLNGARFQDFSTGGDIAIEIVATKLYNMVTGCRFLNCDTEITGLTGKNIAANNIEE